MRYTIEWLTGDADAGLGLYEVEQLLALLGLVWDGACIRHTGNALAGRITRHDQEG